MNEPILTLLALHMYGDWTIRKPGYRRAVAVCRQDEVLHNTPGRPVRVFVCVGASCLKMRFREQMVAVFDDTEPG